MPEQRRGATQIRDIRLTAYRASGLRNQYLEFNNAFAPLSGKPIVNAGFDNAPPTLSGGPGYEYVASMSLPAGSWVMVAKAWLESSVAFGFDRVRCTLGDGTSTDEAELYIPSPQTIDNVQPATLIWSGGGASGAVVTLSCHVANAGVNVKWLKMTAYKAGKLKSSPLE